MKYLFLFLSMLLSSCATPCSPGALVLIGWMLPKVGDWDMQTGTTQRDAVVITNAKNRRTLDRTEEAWFHSHCNSVKIVSRQVVTVGHQQIEIVQWHGVDGRDNSLREADHVSYFDITHAYKKESHA